MQRCAENPHTLHLCAAQIDAIKWVSSRCGIVRICRKEVSLLHSFVFLFFFFFFSNIWPHFALCTHGSLNLGAKNRRKLNYITLLSEFMFSTTLTSLSSAACCLSRCSLPSNTPSPCSTAYFRFVCVNTPKRESANLYVLLCFILLQFPFLLLVPNFVSSPFFSHSVRAAKKY